MAIGKKRDAVKKLSGGILKVLEVTPTGPIGTETASQWLDLGYVAETTLRDETEIIEDFDESGNKFVSEEGNRTVRLEGQLMQSDAELIEFLTDTIRGKFYSVYHYDGITDGNHQEYIFPICKIRPLTEVRSGTKRPPFEISVLKNESDINFGGTSQAALPSEAKATTVVITKDKYYKIATTPVV